MVNRNRPLLQKCPTARECRAELKKRVESECCQRLRRIGNLVGRDRVFVGTVAFEGVHNASDGFTLTDPVLHTLSKRRNGSTDKGEEGMNRFFATHECNALCRRLGLNPEPPYHDN